MVQSNQESITCQEEKILYLYEAVTDRQVFELSYQIGWQSNHEHSFNETIMSVPMGIKEIQRKLPSLPSFDANRTGHNSVRNITHVQCYLTVNWKGIETKYVYL